MSFQSTPRCTRSILAFWRTEMPGRWPAESLANLPEDELDHLARQGLTGIVFLSVCLHRTARSGSILAHNPSGGGKSFRKPVGFVRGRRFPGSGLRSRVHVHKDMGGRIGFARLREGLREKDAAAADAGFRSEPTPEPDHYAVEDQTRVYIQDRKLDLAAGHEKKLYWIQRQRAIVARHGQRPYFDVAVYLELPQL